MNLFGRSLNIDPVDPEDLESLSRAAFEREDNIKQADEEPPWMAMEIFGIG